MTSLKSSMVENIWEDIHSQRAWGKYPNEELVRFIGRNFFKNPREERKNIKILEGGCGQGANIWFLAKEGFDVYGIDISLSAIRKAEKYLSEAYNVKADLKVADARELPYENEFFDIAINCASIQHLPFKDHENVYNEINRVLKQDGYFWSFHIAKGSWGYGTGNLIDYETFDNLSEGPLADVGITGMLSDKDLKSQLCGVGGGGSKLIVLRNIVSLVKINKERLFIGSSMRRKHEKDSIYLGNKSRIWFIEENIKRTKQTCEFNDNSNMHASISKIWVNCKRNRKRWT